jgi:hypothetical protein
MVVERVLSEVDPAAHPALLAYLEQQAKARGDLPQLRAIRDYRRMLETSTKPPLTD